MARGYVLVDSMRPGSRLKGLPLTLTKIERYPVRNATPEQPSVWTTVEFQFPEEEAGRLADALAEVLEERVGWYSLFNVKGETFVVYAGRVFRYPSGDNAGRAEAEDYALGRRAQAAARLGRVGVAHSDHAPAVQFELAWLDPKAQVFSSDADLEPRVL